MNDFTIPLTTRQEQFSIAYLRAIASVAGYSIEEMHVDMDSLDASIMQRGNEQGFPLIESLRVQLKCTYSHSPKNGHLAFPLSKKNYDDLRRECLNPRILVVVHVPKNLDDWIDHQNQQMLLRHEAYWKNLHGMPATSNKDSITVKLDTKQKLTVGELQRLMNILARGQKP